MPFPTEDKFWMQARSFLEKYAEPLDAVLAPNEFLDFFPGTYFYNVSYLLPAEQFQFVVFHKGMATEIEAPVAFKVLEQFHPVFANEVFVIYAKALIAGVQPPDKVHITGLVRQFDEVFEAMEQPRPTTYAAVITTYNRPQSLARSLPQVLALGISVVVVDDASTPENDRENQQIAAQHCVPLIRIPENRGLPNAMNVGLEYWLADPDIDWISYFQDDVDIHPDTLKVLAQVQDSHDRPLLAGRDALEHPNFGTGEIAGHKVLYKRSMPGQHLHAHRDYWRGVMPIPTPYLGAPKPDKGKPGQGADEDWWITCWSPRSIVKQGGYVVCVPGLVRSFRTSAADSTWGNLSELAVESRTVAFAQPIAVAESATQSKLPEVELPEVKSSEVKSSEVKSPEELPPKTAIVVPPDLSLAGVNVLIDGYNLQLTKGTGIKTYGLSLVQALTLLEAHVDVLLSRGGYKSNEILNEVLFFDNLVENRSLPFLLKGLAKTASPLYRARRRKGDRNFVVTRGQYSEDFLKYAASFNLPQCYDIANILYKKLKLKTQISIPEKIDLWHATYPLPMQIRGAKKITTVHDLIPLRLPYATLDDKENFYFKIRDALKESSAIITVSESSKQDLLTYFDEADPDKIIVTYQPIALDPLIASRREIAEFLERYGLEPQKYFLFVGAIEPKKNVGRLIDAYAGLDTDLPLVIVGKKGWLWEDELSKVSYVADSKNPGKQVKLLEYVPANSLRYLYSGAFCLVFPSLYEGFGLPPVEAMSFGCPVITSNVSCLPEICGDAALYVDPYEVGDIRDKMEGLLGNPALRSQLSTLGKQVVKFFSMENYLRRIHAAYRQALK